MSVDVHVVLSMTRVRQYNGPAYQQPPYGDGAFEIDRIQEHYLAAGANAASVRIVSEEEFTASIKDISERVFKVGAIANGTSEKEWLAAAKATKNFDRRFKENGNMMYMRHLVYAAAEASELNVPYNYTHMLYTREDNVFVRPPYTLMELARTLDGGSPRDLAPAAVAVDKFCGWGAHSDKIYFANRRGAEVLFPSTEEEHVRRMARWINRAYRAKRRGDPLQTEEFFKELLDDAGAKVEKIDFHRNDVRYVKDKETGQVAPCIAEAYRRCTSDPAFPECK